MDSLPEELILQIIRCRSAILDTLVFPSADALLDLGPKDSTPLFQVSKTLNYLLRDQELWRSWCYDHSSTKARRQAGEAFPGPSLVQQARNITNQQHQSSGNSHDRYQNEKDKHEKIKRTGKADAERARTLRNWDPSYSTEKVDWYREYVARHAPLSTSWLQQPEVTIKPRDESLDALGVALYRSSHGTKVVAPIEDGSIALWNIGHEYSNPEEKMPGVICARSKPGILSPSHPVKIQLSNRSRKLECLPVECVSVDGARNKVYVAVGKYLHETDLNTLQPSAVHSFNDHITAISEASSYLPPTVGTYNSLDIWDHRQPRTSTPDGVSDAQLDPNENYSACQPLRPRDRRRRKEDASIRALLLHTPLSILHLHHRGTQDSMSGDICVSGRAPSLLIYDRRKFPQIRTTIYSGASLSSTTVLPYPFRAAGMDLMRQNQLSIREVEEAKAPPGNTLIACGEYNGKGSLELYGLSGDPQPAPVLTDSVYKNRHSASSCKLLSVAAHGTRLLVSDGHGAVRWFERDGQTLVRAWNINEQSDGAGPRPSGQDVVRKVLPVAGQDDDDGTTAGGGILNDEVLIWTGERIGAMRFAAWPRFGTDRVVKELEEMVSKRDQEWYAETMRTALERQADEVRWMGRFGLQAGPSPW